MPVADEFPLTLVAAGEDGGLAMLRLLVEIEP